MSRPMHFVARRVALTVFALAAIVVLPTRATAGDYRVWYFDNVTETFQMGDVTAGDTKLVPPQWACGLRLITPSYYRWVNDTGGTISSANFNKNVHVWIPKPGCPQGLTIEYADGSQSFPHVSGASYMEIFTNYGVLWVDANGTYPSCNGCTGPGSFFSPTYEHWAAVVFAGFKTVSASLLDSRLRTRAVADVSGLLQHVQALVPELQRQITLRRRLHPLRDRETTVRVVEDAAVAALNDGKVWTERCVFYGKSSRFIEAYTACTVAAQRVDRSERLVQTAEHLMRRPDR